MVDDLHARIEEELILMGAMKMPKTHPRGHQNYVLDSCPEPKYVTVFENGDDGFYYPVVTYNQSKNFVLPISEYLSKNEG